MPIRADARKQPASQDTQEAHLLPRGQAIYAHDQRPFQRTDRNERRRRQAVGSSESPEKGHVYATAAFEPQDALCYRRHVGLRHR
jgi:hypothetical protein